MIKIELNNKTHIIPSMDELTVNQFIELKKRDLNIISYLSVVCETTFKEVFNTKLKGYKALKKRLGKLEDYTKLPYKKQLIIGDDVINTSEIGLTTVGQRYMIEENGKKLKDEELLCFVLAVAILNDSSSEDNPVMKIGLINEKKNELMTQPYKNILPTAFFLANRFLIGKSSAMNYLKMSRQLINTRIFAFKQVLKAFHRT